MWISLEVELNGGKKMLSCHSKPLILFNCFFLFFWGTRMKIYYRSEVDRSE